MMRARMSRASVHRSASSRRFCCCRAGGGGSRRVRVSCMATLLIGRWLRGRNQAAVKESVDDHPRVEQIVKLGETRITVCAECRWPVAGCFPIGPIGRDERPAAVGKHHEQKQNAAAMNGTHDLKGGDVKRMAPQKDCPRT